MKKYFLWLPALLFLAGCMSYNVSRYGQMDLAEKTISFPPGGGDLPRLLKSAFHKNGWSIYADNIVRTADVKSSDETQLKNDAMPHYRLICQADPVDTSLRFETIYKYDISIIDNRTNREVFSLSGTGEEDRIVEKLLQAIAGP